MLNLGSTTPNATSFLAQSTPINQSRTANGFLFNSTGTQPSTLTSTPFGSTTFFGSSTPATTTTTASTGTGTTQKFDAVAGTDKINRNGIQTQIRTKLFNICAMPVYEKKSPEELRLEDYIDNRKFGSSTTNVFSSATSSTPLFGGTSTVTNPTTAASSIFGSSPASTTTSTLTSSLFGNKPPMTATSSAPFSFGSTTAPTTATSSPFTFGATTGAAAATTTTTTPFTFGSSTTSTANPVVSFGSTSTTAPAATTSLFTFGSSQPQATTTTTTTPAFGFGSTTSLFPTVSTASTSTTFGFPAAKPATAPFSFTTTTTAAPAQNTAPTLFSATATNPAQPVLTTQPSVDARTHLQLFQTMLNIQPFNSELGFLARNIKPNIGLDRARLRTAPDSSNLHSMNNVFSPLLTKPSVLPSTTSTPPSVLINPLPTHPHTVPSVLLPSSTTNSSLGLFGKRKLADSFLDDDDDNSLMMDDGPSSIHKMPKANAIKRPRVLDMNKIRSIVLGGGTSVGGGGGGGAAPNESLTKEENLSETFVVKSTSENLSGWKKFATYDAYLASKKPAVTEEEKPQLYPVLNQLEQERAFRLPVLTHDDYYTKPTIDELRNHFNEQGQCLVKEFTVGREHYGSVTFQGSKINLAGLDLNRLIEIGRRQVTVYPDDKNKPKEGDELNCPAVISLLGVYPIDRSVSNSGEEVTDPDRLIEMNYANYLREMTKKFQGKFIDYDVYTGTWTFKVDHF